MSAAKTYEKIALVASEGVEAQAALKRLAHRYGNIPASNADAIVALGGDGFMLETLHKHLHDHVPIYGMNRGSVGFLMNEYAEDNLAAIRRLVEWAGSAGVARKILVDNPARLYEFWPTS